MKNRDKVRIICTYKEQDDTIDAIIIEHFKKMGAVWYAQGFDFKTRERDICFTFNVHTPPTAPNPHLTEALDALRKIASGTEDPIPPFRAMPRERMMGIAQDSLKPSLPKAGKEGE